MPLYKIFHSGAHLAFLQDALGLTARHRCAQPDATVRIVGCAKSQLASTPAGLRQRMCASLVVYDDALKRDKHTVRLEMSDQ